MPGLLLDTHALYWLASGKQALTDDALIAIGDNQAARTLFVSPITAWELSLAARKPVHRDPPQLDASVATWFRAAVKAMSAKIIAINVAIAIEAGEVPVATGHKDPGDCYLIATARVRKLSLLTRDGSIHALSAKGYVAAITC